jgi:hypothetical protein
MRLLSVIAVALAVGCAGTPIPVDPTPVPQDRECDVNQGSACCRACTNLERLGCEHWGDNCGMMCLSAAPPPEVWAEEVAAAKTSAEAEWAITRWWTGYVCAPEGSP